ncbi:MAG: SRPBCC family protein [Dehalococcoidia bacterium]
MTHPATLQVTTPNDREIVITRDFNARPALVFDAHTKPELVKRWMFGPDGWSFSVCDIDLRVGGKYRFVWRKGDEEMGMGGTYRDIARPERLVSSELFDEDWTGGETLNTMLLTEMGGGTRLTTTLLYSSKEARDGALQSGMDEGMAAGYDRLDAILAE